MKPVYMNNGETKVKSTKDGTKSSDTTKSAGPKSASTK